MWKNAIITGLLYGIGAGAACYLGYIFGCQETELKYERELRKAAIDVLRSEGRGSDSKESEEGSHE